MTKKSLHLIGFLLLITLLVTSFNVFQFFFEKANFQYSDWLINYQAGFVRRGLIGEIFYQLSNLFKFRLDIIIFFFVIALYFAFYLNFFKIIKKIKIKVIDLFIILSPISFFYTAFEQKVSGRKEIIFLSLFSLFILMIKKISPKYQIIFIIFLTTITALTHSGLIFYNVYFLALFACYNYKLGFKKITIFSIPFFISSLIVLFLISTNSTISNIELKTLCNSIAEYLPNCGEGDYVTTLTWGLKKILMDLSYCGLIQTTYFSIFFFHFCFIIFLYAANKSSIKILIFLCYTYLFNFYFTLYVIGADYGRYLHISYISSILIYYFLLSERIIKREINFNNLSKIIIIPILVLYSFTFTVPFCCKTKPKFNYIKLID